MGSWQGGRALAWKWGRMEVRVARARGKPLGVLLGLSLSVSRAGLNYEGNSFGIVGPLRRWRSYLYILLLVFIWGWGREPKSHLGLLILRAEANGLG
jgi:hypothetical protein